MTMRWTVLLSLLSLTLGSLCATDASAATYTVQSCRAADGKGVPAGDASGGWRPETDGPGRYTEDACVSADPQLRATVGGDAPVELGGVAQWRFESPTGTYISAFTIGYRGYARPYDNFNQGVIGVRDSESGVVTWNGGSGSVTDATVAVDNRHARAVTAYALCDGPTGNPGCPAGTSHAFISVRRATFVIADEAPPTSQPTTGSAVDSAKWKGTQTLAVSASDVGGGLYRWFVDVDGSRTLSGPVDANSSWCSDTSAGARVFSTPQPCPSSADLILPINADALPPGPHDVTVRVSDAAGNEHTVFTARRVIAPSERAIGPGTDLAVRGAANGSTAADEALLSARWARTTRRTLSAGYGSRQTIRGRLTTPQHVAIGGGKVELLARLAGRGAPLDKGGARTRPDGRFTIVLPRNLSSRDLELRYRARVNDTVPAAWTSLQLRVRAAVTLRAAPRRVTVRRPTVLAGHLVARPYPPGGKVLELQARDPGGRWLTFRTVRTNSRGRYRTIYRFRRPGPATFEVRVRARASSDYPYATGASRVARLYVR